MIRRKVRIASGLFDRTSPSYGRAKIRFEGGLTPDARRDEPTNMDPFNRAELLAMKDRATFGATVAAMPKPDLTPRLRPASGRRAASPRFVNRARLSRAKT